MENRDGRKGTNAAEAEARYCALCGRAPGGDGRGTERFGEAFCSETHAEEFAAAVRAARIQSVAAAQHASAETKRPAGPVEAGPTSPNWKSYLGKAICWGVPLLVVVFLLAGGGAVLGAASAVLPVLAFLACPLGMYLMMRSMSKMRHGDDRGDGGAKQ